MYIEGNHVQCDHCEIEIPIPFSAGVIILQEVPSQPMRTPIAAWQTLHFHDFEEMREWAQDQEQVLKPGLVVNVMKPAGPPAQRDGRQAVKP